MALVVGRGRQRSSGGGTERGVTTTEYALVLAGVAALVMAAFLVSPDAMRQLYAHVFCHFGGSCADPGVRSASPIDPWDSPDPLTRATWGKMVVLGDSYSSGEGDDAYGVAGSSPSCHASAKGYGPAVASSLGMSDRLTVSACTGATLSDLGSRYRDHDQPPQLDSVDGDTSLITMTMGGNDVGWATLLAQCVEQTVVDPVPGLTCERTQNSLVTGRIRQLEPTLERAYRELRQQAPHARIVVLGYPRFFPENPADAVTAGVILPVINRADEAWMNAKTTQLNQVIAAAAAAQGVEYVDATNALDGHEVTSDDPWIWGLDRQNWHSLGGARHDFHPTPEGQAALAKLVERQITQR